MSCGLKEALLWTLFIVAVAQSLPTFLTGGSRLLRRRPRSVNLEPYGPCKKKGFQKDLQLTSRTISQNNGTLTRMKQEVFSSRSFDTSSMAWDELPTSADFEEDSGLVPLFRNLSRYLVTFPRVIHEARHLDSYSATLRRSMHNTSSDLDNLLFKLNLTMTVAGQSGDPTVPQGWTAAPVLTEVEISSYDHYLRDFTFFQSLQGVLELLRVQLVARLRECPQP